MGYASSGGFIDKNRLEFQFFSVQLCCFMVLYNWFLRYFGCVNQY